VVTWCLGLAISGLINDEASGDTFKNFPVTLGHISTLKVHKFKQAPEQVHPTKVPGKHVLVEPHQPIYYFKKNYNMKLMKDPYKRNNYL
jgi:hypothetical protein